MSMPSGLAEQAIKKLNGLSDDHLLFLIDFIDRFMKPDQNRLSGYTQNRVGIAKNKRLYAEDYDFDELDEQIAEMFGGTTR